MSLPHRAGNRPDSMPPSASTGSATAWQWPSSTQVTRDQVRRGVAPAAAARSRRMACSRLPRFRSR